MDKHEGLDALLHFLELGCRFDRAATTQADDFYKSYRNWSEALGIPPVRRFAVTHIFKEVGFRGSKVGEKYVFWKGLEIVLTEPPEEAPPPDPDKEIRRFLDGHVSHSDWASCEPKVLAAAYRAWCRRQRIGPEKMARLEKVLKNERSKAKKVKRRDGSIEWDRIRCSWPK